MKNIRFGVLLHLTLLFELRLFGRNKPQQILLILQFQSMITMLFLLHIFILKMEQVLVQQVVSRVEYWQNRADYQLTAKLDEKTTKFLEQELLHTQITVLK
jgi:hypothetical protein